MLSTIFTIIQNISVIIAAIIAIYGINSWRREAKWKRKFKLAEEVLALFYDAKDKLQIIRSPFTFGDEGLTRIKTENETEKEKRIYDMAYVPFERYNANNETFQKLLSIKYRFLAVFGSEHSKPFEEIQKIINQILGSARMLATSYWKRQGENFTSDYHFQLHLKNMEKHESNIWFSEEDDEIAERVNKAILEIESVCKKIRMK